MRADRPVLLQLDVEALRNLISTLGVGLLDQLDSPKPFLW